MPDRLPLSTLFDEVDATLIFDDVLVPWDRIFAYRNPELVNRLLKMINPTWAGYVSMIRFLSKLETFFSVAKLLTHWDGRSEHSPTQSLLGQIVKDIEVVRACIRAMEVDASRTSSGHLAPKASDAYRLHCIDASDRAERLMEDILTSSLVLTGGESDLDAPEIGHHVERFFRGNSPTTRLHLRLLAIAGDMVQSAFAGRAQLYERFHIGQPDAIYQRLYRSFDGTAAVRRVEDFLDRRKDST
jgi:aromatic ring hydroxylase